MSAPLANTGNTAPFLKTGKVFVSKFLHFTAIFVTCPASRTVQMQESGVDLDFDQLLDLENGEMSGIPSSECYEIVSKPIVGRSVSFCF